MAQAMVGIVQDGVFVFAVCGGAEHIETLHYSLNALRKHSNQPIRVVTDSRRNEVPLKWHDVIDIETPDRYSHHEASIHLKTSLHRLLPIGPTYCYLDSDIVAVSEDADQVFSFKQDVVTFAPDHCTIDKFSPYAVPCGCRELSAEHARELREIWNQPPLLEPQIIAPPKAEAPTKPALPPANGKAEPNLLQKLGRPVKRKIGRFLPEPVKRPLRAVYDGAKIIYHQNKPERPPREKRKKKRPKEPLKKPEPRFDYWRFDVSSNRWQCVPKGSPYKWRMERKTGKWTTNKGDSAFLDARCTHLAERIKSTFGVRVGERQWQHWNGGVFLFAGDSVDFMDTWHGRSVQVFTDKKWVTRDQGTLAATAWSHGLQNAPLLPVKFNTIADYHAGYVTVKNDRLFDVEKVKPIDPALVHIYHHWKDETWAVWNWIDDRVVGRVQGPVATTGADT